MLASSSAPSAPCFASRSRLPTHIKVAAAVVRAPARTRVVSTAAAAEETDLRTTASSSTPAWRPPGQDSPASSSAPITSTAQGYTPPAGRSVYALPHCLHKQYPYVLCAMPVFCWACVRVGMHASKPACMRVLMHGQSHILSSAQTSQSTSFHSC
jgi:hypothetical protein